MLAGICAGGRPQGRSLPRLIFERERLRQRLLHALEMLSLRLVRQGRFGEAVEAALLAVGNLIEARRAYARYAQLLARELGVRPGAELTRLVAEYSNRSTGGEIL